jgi:tetratricopeptide (TPR) repeat protein
MLELTMRSLGLFHFQVGNLLSVMSTCYRNIDRFESADACLQQMIVVKEFLNDGSAEKNKELFTSMGILAELYMEMGRVELACELLRKMEAAAKEEDSFGTDSFERGRALNGLGDLKIVSHIH